MTVSEEKMMILKMLQEGKITADEAARLIEAIEGGQKQTASDSSARQQKQTGFQDEMYKTREKINEMRDKINNFKMDFKSNQTQKDFDRVVEDFASKAEKLGKNVAATTFGIVDKVVDFVGSFVDTGSFSTFGSLNVIEKAFEAIPTEGTDLEVEALNGSILVKKHEDSRIIIKSKVRSPINNADSILMFNDSGSVISLKVNKVGNISVQHEIYLPAVRFKNIKLETANGKIYVEDSLSDSFAAVTRNSHIDLMGVNSNNINVSTKNARILVNYVMGKNIDINTNNSIIDIKNVKAETLKAVTMNGRILVDNILNYENCPEMGLLLKTSNGGIKVNMNDVDNRGFRVKARTINGGINLLIPQLVYRSANKQTANERYAEAESENYNSYSTKVNISAETVNGYIEVVR